MIKAITKKLLIFEKLFTTLTFCNKQPLVLIVLCNFWLEALENKIENVLLPF